MKRIIYFSVISLILLIETGCSHDKRVENKFALAAEFPKIEELTVNEVLKPLDIITTDNYICILHEEKSSGIRYMCMMLTPLVLSMILQNEDKVRLRQWLWMS